MVSSPILLSSREIVIDNSNYKDFIDMAMDGNIQKRGLIPRNYRKYPVGHYRGCPPMQSIPDLPLIPEGEMDARAKDMADSKSRLSDVMMASCGGAGYPSLDQNGQGFCWAYSTAGTIMAVRAVQNQPHVRLSAHAVACKIKNFQDEGGWGALSMEYAMEHGYPSVEKWAEKSMSRSYDTPDTWANAALHKPVEGWIDLQAQVYDRNLTKAQLATCLLCRIPVVVDFNWWSHSVFAVDLVSWNPFRIRIRNSWTDSFGERGFAVIDAPKSTPDGGVGLRTTVPSVN